MFIISICIVYVLTSLPIVIHSRKIYWFIAESAGNLDPEISEISKISI
uniref:TROVE domain-containing protein n=1 Tax=Parascaris univalens TaxID=6257 RepID=A0A915B8Q6_PARUN